MHSRADTHVVGAQARLPVNSNHSGDRLQVGLWLCRSAQLDHDLSQADQNSQNKTKD